MEIKKVKNSIQNRHVIPTLRVSIFREINRIMRNLEGITKSQRQDGVDICNMDNMKDIINLLDNEDTKLYSEMNAYDRIFVEDISVEDIPEIKKYDNLLHLFLTDVIDVYDSISSSKATRIRCIWNDDATLRSMVLYTDNSDLGIYRNGEVKSIDYVIDNLSKNEIDNLIYY